MLFLVVLLDKVLPSLDCSIYPLECYNSLVGTTAKGAEQLPDDVAADEKHSHWNGKTAYVATTVGEGCFWGASLSLGVDEASLSETYGVFKEEAQAVQEDYEAKTVNTDGFKSTMNAWASSLKTP